MKEGNVECSVDSINVENNLISFIFFNNSEEKISFYMECEIKKNTEVESVLYDAFYPNDKSKKSVLKYVALKTKSIYNLDKLELIKALGAAFK